MGERDRQNERKSERDIERETQRRRETNREREINRESERQREINVAIVFLETVRNCLLFHPGKGVTQISPWLLEKNKGKEMAERVWRYNDVILSSRDHG